MKIKCLESGWAVEEDVVERAAFAASGADHHAEAFDRALLTHEVVELRWA